MGERWCGRAERERTGKGAHRRLAFDAGQCDGLDDAVDLAHALPQVALAGLAQSPRHLPVNPFPSP